MRFGFLDKTVPLCSSDLEKPNAWICIYSALKLQNKEIHFSIFWKDCELHIPRVSRCWKKKAKNKHRQTLVSQQEPVAFQAHLCVYSIRLNSSDFVRTRFAGEKKTHAKRKSRHREHQRDAALKQSKQTLLWLNTCSSDFLFHQTPQLVFAVGYVSRRRFFFF